MRPRIALLLTIAAVSVATEAQSSAVQAAGSAPNLALQYTYLRSNAPVGQSAALPYQYASSA